ncbi:MAG: PAS domain-containing protein, partial [Stellaceae bacterium]
CGMQPDPSLAFERPELGDLLCLWQAKRRGGAMPTRADLTPFDLKAHLGNLILTDVEPDPLRFRYRLVGTNITRIVKRDATGGYFDKIYTGRLRETALAVNTWVVRERAPLRIFSRMGHERNDIYTYEGALLPLSADGERVNMVLGALLFSLVR